MKLSLLWSRFSRKRRKDDVVPDRKIDHIRPKGSGSEESNPTQLSPPFASTGSQQNRNAVRQDRAHNITRPQSSTTTDLKSRRWSSFTAATSSTAAKDPSISRTGNSVLDDESSRDGSKKERRMSFSRTRADKARKRRSFFGGRADSDEHLPCVPAVPVLISGNVDSINQPTALNDAASKREEAIVVDTIENSIRSSSSQENRGRHRERRKPETSNLLRDPVEQPSIASHEHGENAALSAPTSKYSAGNGSDRPLLKSRPHSSQAINYFALQRATQSPPNTLKRAASATGTLKRWPRTISVPSLALEAVELPATPVPLTRLHRHSWIGAGLNGGLLDKPDDRRPLDVGRFEQVQKAWDDGCNGMVGILQKVDNDDHEICSRRPPASKYSNAQALAALQFGFDT